MTEEAKQIEHEHRSFLITTDRKLDLKKWERGLMLGTFVIMLAIELSLLWDKPGARVFAFTVLTIGLILRGLGQTSRETVVRLTRRCIAGRMIVHDDDGMS